MKSLLKKFIPFLIVFLALAGIVKAATILFPQQGGTGTGTVPNTGGKVLISTNGGVYTPAYLTAGSNITIASSSGGITISGTGSSSTFKGIGFNTIGGSFVKITSISFDPGAFNISNTASVGKVFIDYANGPASRSIAQTISGQWAFTSAPLGFTVSNNASISSNLEIGGYASASAIKGSAFNTGTCTGQTALQWSTTGIFTCSGSFQTQDATLTALAAYNTNGLLTQTAADTFTGRTVTGTINQITATNGDGVAGNPTLSVPALFVITTASLSGNLEVAGYASASQGLFGQASQINLRSVGASLSVPFEDTAYASAAKYFGAGLTACGDSTHALSWTAGIFGCQSISGASGITAQSGVAATEVVFFQSSSVASGSALFQWDTVNKRLGINYGGAVDTTLEVGGTASISGQTSFGSNASLAGNFELTGAGSKLGINAGGVINTTFEVGGTASISGLSTFGNSASIALNLEVNGYASASAFKGSAFSTGNCTGQTALQWSTTGIFTCSGSFQSLDATLTALAAYNTNGLVTQTAADTFTGRTLTGTTNQITITNGDGVAGNPTVSIPTLFVAPGSASVSTNLEVTGTASASNGRFNVSLIVPTSANNTNINTLGQININTSSNSLNFYNGTSEQVIPSDICNSYSFRAPNFNNIQQYTVYLADDNYTLSHVASAVSGSNSFTWNLRVGSATVPLTNVFTLNKKASKSAGVSLYTAFGNAAVSQNTRLDISIVSPSAQVQTWALKICLKKNPQP